MRLEPLETDCPIIVEDVTFSTGPYALQGELAYASDRAHTLAVIAGPHPLLGGNLHNNVVRALGDGLAERGMATLRFNYRGVGRSLGPRIDFLAHLSQFWATSHVPDESDLWRDVQAAVDFLNRSAGSDKPLILIGYSFGCSLLPQVRIESEPAAYILIAPTVTKHDYEAYLQLPSPVLVIASEDDFVTSRQQLDSWFERLPRGKLLVRMPMDNHFFRGHEPWLVETVEGFVEEQTGSGSEV
jgi:alpha/beta superfamily hydrolase